MGREIRRVPPNWEHPKTEEYNPRTLVVEQNYQPMHDDDVESAFREWMSEWGRWQESEFAEVQRKHPDCKWNVSEPYRSFCEWHGEPPDPKYYHPVWEEGSATWYQIYETVSEGSPVSPPFATKGELVEYLVKHGDFWDQKRGDGGWDRANAERFVERGHAFSMMVNATPQVAVIKEPRDGI